MDDVHYTEGVCGDGAAILFDGKPLTVSEILNRLNTIERLQRELAAEREDAHKWRTYTMHLGVAKAVEAQVKAERERYEARAELEKLDQSLSATIDERDKAEEAVGAIYKSVTGETPEWSNLFGFEQAVDGVAERVAAFDKALAWYRQHVAELAMPLYDEDGEPSEARSEIQDEAYRLLQEDAGRRAALGGEG